MLTIRQVVTQIRSEDWFVLIYLEDAYFHISILPTHRKFLWFAFGGKAYQYRVLPFGLALSPRTFTKCVDATLALLWLRGIRILNYIGHLQCCGMVYAPDLFPVLWPGLTGRPRLFHPLALDLFCRYIHWEGTVKSGSIGISFPQLEFPKRNPGFSRERDAASRCHTCGIQCWLHSSCRHWIHCTCFYTSWPLHHLACDVSPILGQILLMFRVGYAEGVPLVSSDAASRSLEEHTEEEEEFFICHIHNYTEYNQQ